MPLELLKDCSKLKLSLACKGNGMWYETRAPRFAGSCLKSVAHRADVQHTAIHGSVVLLCNAALSSKCCLILAAIGMPGCSEQDIIFLGKEARLQVQ